MTTITKRLEIDAGHRLLKHEGKCANVHGHRYAFEVTCTADKLDAVGRVVDFGVIKEKLGRWLDEAWDHGFLIEQGDPLIEWLKTHKQKHVVLVWPPTAENLARQVFNKATELLTALGVHVVHVTCYETPTSRAGYSERA